MPATDVIGRISAMSSTRRSQAGTADSASPKEENTMDPAVRSTLSRRAAVRLGGGGIAALAARGPARAAAQGGTAATFVLVHGAWAGAWIWRKVAPLLRAAGHEVYASTATGMGDRVHLADPAIDLDTFVTDVVNLLEFEDLTQVTLVGWSFGGMTITGVAERVPERLAQLVYLDAVVPADGESANDPLPVWTDFVRAMAKDPADQEGFLAKLVRQPLPTFAQPMKLGNPASAAVPRAFVHCTEGAMEPFASIAARVRSDAGWRYREVADDHFAAINAPQVTADALLALL